MDTSKEYIKMCEKAWEIQRIAPKEDTVKALEDYKSELFYLPLENKIALGHWDNDEGDWMIGHYRDNKEDAIWLPRQDQLQEMVDVKDGRSFSDALTDIYEDFMEGMKDYYYDSNSMEQLWLAFVMKEKFNKVWDGEEWIS